MVGRKALQGVFTLFTPDTLLRWQREAVRDKWDYSKKRRPGRPSASKDIEKLVLQFAQDNPSWGYKHIRDALETLGHKAGKTTIRNILKRHGLNSAPERKKGMSWAQFTRAHWEALVGTDFFTWEVWEPWGLTTYYVLFLIHQASRQVHLAGITTNPNGDWMKQIARNLTMPDWGWLKKGQIVLHDRDGKFCPAFRDILQSEGIRTLMLPYQSPNLNAYAERWVRSLKEECLSKMIILGEPMLRNALREYLAHFHTERNHQGLGRIPFPAPELSRGSPKGKIIRRQRLGGILNFYFREAA
jgi:transposase InsO family protein